MGFPKGVQEARSWSFWLFSFVPPTVFIGCLEITKITWRHQVLEDEGIFKRIARAATPIIMVIIPRSMIRLCQLFCDHQEHLDPEAVPSTSSLPAQPSKSLGSFSSIPKCLNRRCSVDEPPAVQDPFSKEWIRRRALRKHRQLGGEWKPLELVFQQLKAFPFEELQRT
ncbi:hypothetical protein B9Z55_016099 [Caenorhabditis nigoni]|uniref:Uncharacterized protein n=1 Tax=Caenorhabditis nigoni TaxID=1611254 RepID=A0A2G5UD61_9PELO|nr:hypothetical protein B9Z55_016099 [Caenorhabditis nigoni]